MTMDDQYAKRIAYALEWCAAWLFWIAAIGVLAFVRWLIHG